MRALIAISLLLAACYAPKVPGGSYRCALDNACPDGLSCQCGLCVDDPNEAACSFAITSSKDPRTITVEEHEPFPITIQALTKTGTPATKFSAAVTLSSTWGDVCVGSGGCITMPTDVTLVGGTATTMIQLNRETIAPQSAILRAEFAGNVGSSGKLRINVNSPDFTRDASPTVAPLSLTSSFGFATLAVGAPAVVKVSDGWRMYYSGGVTKKIMGKDTYATGIGVATSTDGKTFMPTATPIIESDGTPAMAFGAASAFVRGDQVQLYFGRQQAYRDAAQKAAFGYGTIASLTGSISSGMFAVTPASLIDLSTNDDGCAFCSTLDQPMVIADPNPSLSGGGPNAQIMYFSSTPTATAMADIETSSVVRASSVDGVSFIVDPSPLLRNTTNETVLYAPRVLVDGTVYKMWYSVTDAPRDGMGTALNPCLLTSDKKYSVGYATSDDGYFWVRSPRNVATPVLPVNETAGAWDFDSSLLVSAVVPVDGVDPASGIVLYYSPLSLVVLTCVPNGVGRAVRR